MKKLIMSLLILTTGIFSSCKKETPVQPQPVTKHEPVEIQVDNSDITLVR